MDIRPSGTYADATFGGGGHSRAILAQLNSAGRLLGFDRDIDAKANCPDDPRFTFVLSDFRYMPNFVRFYNAGKLDGILADLGVSFHHFDEAERGFSFRSDAPLDMRMNREAPLTASDIINTYDHKHLSDILSTYGELNRAGAIAAAIIKAREKEPVITTKQLTDIVAPLITPKQQKKMLAQIFQAIRIEVNGEMDSLRLLLENSLKVLKQGGIMAVLTYHSLEDRMVKNFFRSGRIDGETEKDFFGHIHTPWELITRQPVTADEAEVERNPRARSAKLRVARLLHGEKQ